MRANFGKPAGWWPKRWAWKLGSGIPEPERAADQPWLKPGYSRSLRTLHARGTRNVVVAPIGFVSDHMEVLYDLIPRLGTGSGIGDEACQSGDGWDPSRRSSGRCGTYR